MLEINDKDFYELKNRSQVTLVDFWAPWCGPCRMVSPVLEELSSELTNINFVKLNIDEYQEAAGEHGIMSIPTLLVVKEGQVLEQITGFRPKGDLKNLLEKYN
ncbi:MULTISPECIES: thioredoxin [unclassified Gemella]|uniref:thioredoxin n=1 Tax=unclassified Gemella TaxID=2624949 RepID=UPI00107306DC|nr:MULTISPECIES: thioredoxin [unclassified Gemella]MBF0709614.1 thioredoxin [Gemella sp. GL1.1]MBF0746246.1 thioredoxin [Gemella sp. 19428wG2_WT2a]NYS26958.1 thioredoxin [Gemella sp. GL1]TFU60527.1 thioredoxin [Gemella sp. WT2a]